MRAVRAAYETNAVKYRSAGRLPIGSQEGVEYLFRLVTSYTPSPLRGPLRPAGKHVTGFSGRFAPLQIQFLCHLKGTQGRYEIWFCVTGAAGRSAGAPFPRKGVAPLGDGG